MHTIPVGPRPWMLALSRGYCRVWQRLAAEQQSLAEGPLILVGNHRAGVDPLLVQASVNRPLNFLMARDYYDMMWYGRWVFDSVGCIPVMPGGINRRALERAAQALAQGHALCIFPEGAANPDVPMQRVLPGAVVLAMETGAPILPFRVSGVWPFDHRNMWQPFYRRGRAEVRFGELMHLPQQKADRHTIRCWTVKMRETLVAMRTNNSKS
ncbi:MAG: lysophospholipid acyltransferase family protein [Mariprofundaceae bacterium]